MSFDAVESQKFLRISGQTRPARAQGPQPGATAWLCHDPAHPAVVRGDAYRRAGLAVPSALSDVVRIVNRISATPFRHVSRRSKGYSTASWLSSTSPGQCSYGASNGLPDDSARPILNQVSLLGAYRQWPATSTQHRWEFGARPPKLEQSRD